MSHWLWARTVVGGWWIGLLESGPIGEPGERLAIRQWTVVDGSLLLVLVHGVP